ncbi:MAG TPA: Ig domain-containing protein [Caldimonas sp.]|nr:Ig domain-containing protein [Caldimonas sp.]
MKVVRWVVSVVALAGLLAACGGGDGVVAPEAAVVPARAGSADITPAGGSLDAVLEGGATVRLDVPAGALASTTTLRIDPTPGPAGTLGAFTISPAGIALLQPASLVVTLPDGPALDPDISLLIDAGAHRIPLGPPFSPSTRTLAVQLDALTLQATSGAFGATPARSQALRTRPATSTHAGLLFVLQPGFTFAERVTLLELVVSDLAAQGSNDNAALVRRVMEAVLGDPRGTAEPRVHAVTPTWRNVVCGQQQFSVSALNTFTGSDIQTFEQRAKDVLTWDRNALDLNALDARMSPPEPGCAGVPADVADPVRARLPTFLADVRQALALLDPRVAADYTQLLGVRLADMFNLAADFDLVGATDLESATVGVVVSEMVRVRQIAYDECRASRTQTIQSKLLKEALLDEIRSPFHRDDVLQDVQFCGMPLHWKLVDAQGVVLQQGDAGGGGPGATIASVALQATGAAKIVFSGPLAALVCPAGSQNNEQLAFSAGPAAGPLGVVTQLSPSNANGYLESGPLDIDILSLLQQGAEQLVVARQGGLCNGEFLTLGRHAALATFALNRIPLQITTASLPGATVGTAYSATLAASGGALPLVWSATGLPAGLNLNARTGEINGTLTAATTGTVLIDVTSADGQSAQRSVSLTASARTSFAGSVTVTKTFDGQIQNGLTDSKKEVFEFTNVTLVLQPNGSFTATGTVRYTLSEELLAQASGCRTTFSAQGSGPVTAYDGQMPKAPGGTLVGNATYAITQSFVCPGGQSGSSTDPPVTARGLTTLVEADAILNSGNLTELNWNFSNRRTESGGAIVVVETVVGQIR